MSLSAGFVGLPNAGKSTLFNALTGAGVPAENYPFCTIEPNTAILFVTDKRLEDINEVIKKGNNGVGTKKIVQSMIEFRDIAGLVKGASTGAGLGNKFLGNIAEVDELCFVLRYFNDDSVTSVADNDTGNGSLVNSVNNPVRDLEILKCEIYLKDLEHIDGFMQKLEKRLKTEKSAELEKKLDILKYIKSQIETLSSDPVLSEEDLELVREFNLLCIKPRIYILNVDEKGMVDDNLKIDFPYEYIKISASFENSLNSITSIKEKEELLSLYGMKESLVTNLVHKVYSSLGLISFFTEGLDEVRSWTIKKGTKAPKASGVIHTDFEEKFIKLDVVSFENYISAGGFEKAREKGLVRSEGKDYVVNDGDIVLVKHG